MQIYSSKSNSFPSANLSRQPSPSLAQPSRHPASPASAVTQPAQPSHPSQPPSSLPSPYTSQGGSGFLRCFWGFLLGFPVGSGSTLKKVASVAGGILIDFF